MIHSLSFNSQRKMKKESFDVSLQHWRLWIWSIEKSVKTVCFFYTVLVTGFAHLLAWIWWRISNIWVKITVFINKHLIQNLLEFVASVIASDVKEIRKILRNLAKFVLKVMVLWIIYHQDQLYYELKANLYVYRTCTVKPLCKDSLKIKPKRS